MTDTFSYSPLFAPEYECVVRVYVCVCLHACAPTAQTVREKKTSGEYRVYSQFIGVLILHVKAENKAQVEANDGQEEWVFLGQESVAVLTVEGRRRKKGEDTREGGKDMEQEQGRRGRRMERGSGREEGRRGIMA